jgi:para-aminobenzoate synthetase component 1
VVEGHRDSSQAGGGIVADSDPQLEFEETMHKGRAMRDVLEARA